jgi:CarD family transcriptional regulator
MCPRAKHSLFEQEENVEFSVGDKVVHPKHGFGRIFGLEQLDVVEGFNRYYVIEIPDQGLTVHVPVRNVDALGVRPIMSRFKLGQVLDVLRDSPQPLPEDYRERQAWARERLETGDPLRIAGIVRDLIWYERRAHLTEADSALLARGREFLASEIALVTETQIAEANELINDALVDATAKQPDS